MSKADKTADEMFEELGYERAFDVSEEDIYIIFVNDAKEISFCKTDKTVSCCNGHDYYERYERITIPELKAINEKVKELGWEE